MSPSEVTLGPFPEQPPRTVSTLHSPALAWLFFRTLTITMLVMYVTVSIY